jgi:hypothetical protein
VELRYSSSETLVQSVTLRFVEGRLITFSGLSLNLRHSGSGLGHR